MENPISSFEYLSDLHLLRRIDGCGKTFIVSQPYRYAYTYQGKRIEGEVKAGLETDLASIPWIFQWLISKVGNHSEGAVVHDDNYQHMKVDRHLADWMFLAAMDTRKVARWKRRIMFAAVYVGAWWAYGNDKDKMVS